MQTVPLARAFILFMDVTLVLTHRCNLACGYCYAGEHDKRDMDDETMDRALDLLYADGAEVAQLSFFGGEPFLHPERMRRAIEGATRRAEAAGKQLMIQCTTNGTLLGPEQVALIARTGMHVTLSIDGVREAHELNRPARGGGSSFEAAHSGLRALRAAGVRPEAMMVVTPASAPFLLRSVQWLWSEGVHTVRANLELKARWNLAEREELRKELVAVGREMLWWRLRGGPVMFRPFERSFAEAEGAARPAAGTPPAAPGERAQIAVATSGFLYPCAPMVGEDRDDGREATLRLGHVGDGATTVAERVAARGAGCAGGKGCACAAWLETGDRDQPGPNAIWFHGLCERVGAAVGAAILEARQRAREAPVADVEIAAEEPQDRSRRALLGMIVLGAGGLAIGGPVAYRVLFGEPRPLSVPPVPPLAPPPRLPPPEPAGGLGPAEPIVTPPPAPPAPPPAPPIGIRGEIAAPEPPPPPPPQVPGSMARPEPPPPPSVKGDIGPPTTEVKTLGEMKAPRDYMVDGDMGEP